MTEHEGMRLSELQRIAAEQVIQKTKPSVTPGGPQFNQLLSKQLEGKSDAVTFSTHALQRLQKRNISLDTDQIGRLNDAVEKLTSKGAKESLVLMDDMAFIVGVKHKTVITAMESGSMRGNIITNIDSAIIT